ncbi:hypothetical protein QKT49_gp017 [Acanthamoeba castellanii medusavirus]|uniref:Uncharacterized protein n=1 Tax=Acanthamoeba castellanii medusavirus J1 TaxID=3114988 RepID=A0A3T1CWE5_9VIRU|nr:hypothetical protein QKT49_gp017 [Acanthamoeba castellanii medusavirus]BBI30157.1 hypothetical protein [Acanthamoeba castellanii medusavirus J1]
MVCDRYLLRWKATAEICYLKRKSNGLVMLMDGRERRDFWESVFLQQGWRDDINQDPTTHYDQENYTMVQYFCDACNDDTGGPAGYSTYKADGYVLRSWK